MWLRAQGPRRSRRRDRVGHSRARSMAGCRTRVASCTCTPSTLPPLPASRIRPFRPSIRTPCASTTASPSSTGYDGMGVGEEAEWIATALRSKGRAAHGPPRRADLLVALLLMLFHLMYYFECAAETQHHGTAHGCALKVVSEAVAPHGGPVGRPTATSRRGTCRPCARCLTGGGAGLSELARTIHQVAGSVSIAPRAIKVGTSLDRPEML